MAWGGKHRGGHLPGNLVREGMLLWPSLQSSRVLCPPAFLNEKLNLEEDESDQTLATQNVGTS